MKELKNVSALSGSLTTSVISDSSHLSRVLKTWPHKKPSICHWNLIYSNNSAPHISLTAVSSNYFPLRVLISMRYINSLRIYWKVWLHKASFTWSAPPWETTVWSLSNWSFRQAALTGWIRSPPKKLCLSPHPQSLRIWPYLETGSLQTKAVNLTRVGLQSDDWSPHVNVKTRAYRETTTWWQRHRVEFCRCKQEMPKNASKPQKRSKEGFPYRFQREQGAVDTLISDYKPPDLRQSQLLLFLATYFVALVMAALGN